MVLKQLNYMFLSSLIRSKLVNFRLLTNIYLILNFVLILMFQHAGARDEQGNPIIKDFYSSPLTARYICPKE